MGAATMAKVEMMTARWAQISVLGSRLITFLIPSPHLEGPLLPRGIFLGLGLINLAALAQDRLAASCRLPGLPPCCSWAFSLPQHG